MFTGIIETVGRVSSIDRKGDMYVLAVDSDLPANEVAIGESVSVDGFCLTVVRKASRTLSFEISPETVDKTTAKDLRPGSKVNLERALRLSDRLGGHLVAGHVDGVGRIKSAVTEGGFRIIKIALPRGLGRYMIDKGSVAIDGISLTINSVKADEIAIGVIPHTLENTALGSKRPGDRVNVEADLIGKYVEKLSGRQGKGKKDDIDFEYLAGQGFARGD